MSGGFLHYRTSSHTGLFWFECFLPPTQQKLWWALPEMNKSKTTFLDFPLEKDLYECRPLYCEKPPLRVLITDAGQKFVYCLIYKICTGEIFGEDQEVYIHLVNAKGVIDHKTIFLELEECGFHLLKGWVVTSNIEEAYSDVDVVVLTTAFEERSGFTYKETLAGQIIRGRQMMRNIAAFCKPQVQIVLVGPSTKFSLALLQIMHRLEPGISAKNMSVVTFLDEAFARANLAARLKTTTNKIKNIVIWGVTCPDVHNATVRIFPKDDLGALEEVEMPVHDALQDDKYLHDEFIDSVFRRKVGNEFSRSGKSLAIATARHLKALYQGAADGEIISMGVLSPPSEPYSVPHGFPFSFPVNVPGNGTWTVREDVKYDVGTHLNLIKSINNIIIDRGIFFLRDAVNYILEYEEKENDIVRISQRPEITEKITIPPWNVKYFVESLPEEAIPKSWPGLRVKKSIAWDDVQTKEKDEFKRKSSIRFESNDGKRQNRTASILKQKDEPVLPAIQKT